MSEFQKFKRQPSGKDHDPDASSEASSSKRTLSSESDGMHEQKRIHSLSNTADAESSFAEHSAWNLDDSSALLQPPASSDLRKAFSASRHDSHVGRSRKHRHANPVIGSSSHSHSDQHASRWHLAQGGATGLVTEAEDRMKSPSWAAAAVASLSLATSTAVASIASATTETLSADASHAGQETLASTFEQAQRQMVLMKRKHEPPTNLTLSEVLNNDETSSINLLAIIILLGGFVGAFLFCVALSRILAITNRPKAEAFPYQSAGMGSTGGSTASLGAAGIGKGNAKGQMFQPSLSMNGRHGSFSAKADSIQMGLLSSAAPMAGRSPTTEDMASGYGQAPIAMAGRNNPGHQRGTSSGLGFPGPPSAARRGPGAAAGQTHPPLQPGPGDGASSGFSTAPDGAGFQPGQLFQAGGNAGPRLRNPLHIGPPPASDARRQSRYNRAGGGLNGGLGAAAMAHQVSNASGGEPQPRLRDQSNREMLADRRSRIQSVGAGVYRKSMYMGPGAQNQFGPPSGSGGKVPNSSSSPDPGAITSGGLKRVESISRGEPVRYRDGSAVVAQRRPSRRDNSARGNSNYYTAERRSIYDRQGGQDAERGAFLSAQKEGFGAGGPLQPRNNGLGVTGPPQLLPLMTGRVSPIGQLSPGHMGMETLSSPGTPSFVIPSPTAPNYSAFLQQSQAAVTQSARNAAPTAYANATTGGGGDDMFSSIPLPRGASSAMSQNLPPAVPPSGYGGPGGGSGFQIGQAYPSGPPSQQQQQQQQQQPQYGGPQYGRRPSNFSQPIGAGGPAGSRHLV